MRYQIRHALVQYAADTILEDVNFEIHDKEKIAVVGRNGCGKTTLLKLIAGDIKMANSDSDESCGISMAGKQEIGFLRQINFKDGEIPVEDEIKKVFEPVFACEERMKEIEEGLHSGGDLSGTVGALASDASEYSREDLERIVLNEYDELQKKMEAMKGYSWRTDMEIMFQKFGFKLEDLKRPIGDFSGGQQTKIAFIKLLLSRPDIMLLDEPTNHLDLPTIEWLENYLKSYEKSVVLVSHDRMFLDRVTDVTYEIEYHRMKRYSGNYSSFMRQKEENLAKQEKDYEEQQKEIARLTEWIEKWKNTPSKVAATRSKRMAIEHMVKIEKPRHFDTKAFHANFSPRKESYNDVIIAKELSIGYGSELAKVSFRLNKGEKLAIVGENGIGKSTLLKTIVGMLPALGGKFTIGTNVDWGYFDQQKATRISDEVDPEQTVLENFWDEYPDLVREEVRGALGAFLFSQEEVEKKMGGLSGGEKVRLALCKMFFTKPNLLILDEPTNHMDIIGKDALEQSLKNYTGTVLFVSHDRYFINRVATGVLDFAGNGEVRQYDGTYEEYLTEKDKRQKGIITDNFSAGTAKNGTSAAAASKNAPTLDDVFDKKTYYNPGKIRSRLNAQHEKYEKMLEESEKKSEEIKIQMADPALATDYMKLTKLQELLDAELHQQETLLDRMVETEIELEELEANESR